MKKISILLFGLFAAVQVAQAAPTATGTPCPGATTIEGTVAAGFFVVRDTPIRCSANVVVSYTQNTIAFAVGSLSTKGKSFFQGTTGGGAISAQPCTGQTCTADQEKTGLQAKLDAAT